MPTPPGCAAIPTPPAWAAATPLHTDLGRWHNCAAPGAAPCTEPPSYRFLNSGAFAGTAAALHRMLAAVLAMTPTLTLALALALTLILTLTLTLTRCSP